jgi:hypothetical protein
MANKKINQLVSKTSILSTDLFGIGDATTGQLFKKTIAELQAAIGGAVISVNGLVGTVVLDTDDIQELATPTNKWFTDARARAAISLTVTGNSGASTYSSGTGVLNVPTYTLAGLGGITATFLSGGTGISYNSTTGVISYSGTVYTDASIRALFTGGTGITYNSSTGAISYSGTVYTDSSVRALISLTTTGNSGASTYNNTTGVINVPEYTLAGLGGISLTSLSGGTGITYNNTTGAISYSGTVYTDSSIRGLISATSPISYNSTTGVISLSGGNLTEATSSVLTITGGTGAVIGAGTSIQVKQASSTVSGFLSSTDWSTFNNKQGTITLTTTGTSGAATFTSGTLNIPQYQSALTNPVTGTGTNNYVAKFTSSSSIGASQIFDNGTSVGIGNTAPINQLDLNRSGAPTLFDCGFNGVQNGGEIEMKYIAAGQSGGRTGSHIFYTGSTVGGTERFRIAATGAATFQNVNAKANTGQWHLSVQDNTSMAAGVGGGISFNGYKTGTTAQGLYAAIDGFKENATSGNELGGFRIWTSNGTNLVERIRVTSAGNLGVGTTTPDSIFQLGRVFAINQDINSGYITCNLKANGNYIVSQFATRIHLDSALGEIKFSTAPSGSADTAATLTERMRINNAGKVIIGGTTAGTALNDSLTVNTASSGGYSGLVCMTADTSRGYFAGTGNGLEIGVSGSGFLQIVTGGGDRLRITNGGNILMGTTTDNGERLYVSGAIRATGTITANSDLTLKKNLLKIENALEKVEQINGYTYEFKADDSKRYAGVIAQEIQTVLPEIVNKGNDGILGVEYGNISALLIEAIKEQNIKIKNLETLLASK